MKATFRFSILLCSLALLAAFITSSVQAQAEEQPVVVVLTSKGPITPILIEYLERGLKIAADRNAEALILQLDTPGGDVNIMNQIVQVIRNSDIPVIVFIYPRNAMAGSAGTVITLAGHLSAMAPETTIGAASPVGSQGEDIGDTMESKLKEILKASVRALTSQRSPEATSLAEETIENARAVTAEEAKQVGLVDFLAVDNTDLLRQLDGRSVTIKESARVLRTENALVVEVSNTFIEEILLLLINPNLVFLLLTVGVQAILIEISHPGGWVPGFIGVVCLVLAIYGLGILPVNYFGILFLLMAFVLFILDIKAPTHGALTVAGTLSFITGALVLFNTVRVPGIPRLSIPLVVGTGIGLAGFFLTILTFALRAQRRPVQTGKESLIGRQGYVETDLNPRGLARITGELWAAEAEPGNEVIGRGTKVEIIAIEGLVLKVKKVG